MLTAASLVMDSGFKDMASVAEQLKPLYPDKIPYATRERCYDLVREARRRGMFLLVPPSEFQLAQRLKCQWLAGDNARRSIKVVDARHDSRVHVSTAAAELLGSLVLKHAAERHSRKVHIGLGVGISVLHAIERLAELLRTTSDCPDFLVHACIPAGLMKRADQPGGAGQATTAMMAEKLRATGHSAELVEVDWAAYVPAASYAATRSEIQSHRAFKQREAIDIIVVAPARAHEHSVLYDFVCNDLSHELMMQTREGLDSSGYIGDVMCQPFSESGPIDLQRGIRALALFEIDELVEFAARPDKDVVLLGGPCSGCNRRRTAALRPLVAEPTLRIWNHLVVDIDTAEELLHPKDDSHPACCDGRDHPPGDVPAVHRPR